MPDAWGVAGGVVWEGVRREALGKEQGMNTVRYKNYVGMYEYYPDDGEYHGRVIGIRSVVHFCGSTVEEYFVMCRSCGVEAGGRREKLNPCGMQ